MSPGATARGPPHQRRVGCHRWGATWCDPGARPAVSRVDGCTGEALRARSARIGAAAGSPSRAERHEPLPYVHRCSLVISSRYSLTEPLARARRCTACRRRASRTTARHRSRGPYRAVVARRGGCGTPARRCGRWGSVRCSASFRSARQRRTCWRRSVPRGRGPHAWSAMTSSPGSPVARASSAHTGAYDVARDRCERSPDHGDRT